MLKIPISIQVVQNMFGKILVEEIIHKICKNFALLFDLRVHSQTTLSCIILRHTCFPAGNFYKTIIRNPSALKDFQSRTPLTFSHLFKCSDKKPITSIFRIFFPLKSLCYFYQQFKRN